MAREDTIIKFGLVDNLSPGLRTISANLKQLDTALTAAAAGGLAAIAAGVTRSLGEFERLGDAAIKLNVTAQALSGLGFAARQSGADAATLESGLGRLNKTLGEAASGNQQAARLFDAVGVSIRDASGNVLSADKVLLQIADRFQSFEDGAQEAAIASALFGRSAGPELIQFLNQGSAGITALTDEAAAFGLVVTDEAAKAAKLFGDNLDRLKGAGEGFFNSLTTALLPALTEFSTGAAEAAKKGGLLADAGRLIGEQFNLFGVDLITAQSEIQQLGAEIANAVQFVSDWAENLGVVGNIAVVAFQSIAAAAEGNFAAAERGLNGITRAVEALGTKAAVDAAKRMGDLSGAISSIKADAAARIERIRGGVAGLGKDAAPAAAAVGKLKPPTDAFGAAADKAAGNVNKLAAAQQKLTDALRDGFRDGLRPATQSMQEFSALTGQLVRTDIPDIEVAITRVSDSFEGFGNVVTEEAQFFADNWTGAVNAVTDAFADFISGNIKSFQDFGKALESIARQFLSNLVKQFLNTNLQFGGFGTPAPGQGGAMFGGINFGGPGASLGMRLGLGAAGVGIAYQGYQSGNALQGAAGGALAGFQVGGPIGAIVGAIIGGVAAGLNDTTRRVTVIGDNVVGTPGFRNLAPGSTFESRLGGFTFASIDNVSADERRQIGQSVVKFDNTIADLLNDEQLERVTGALANFNLRLEEGAISAENILGARFDAILSTFDEDTQAFVRNAGDLKDQVAALADVLSRPARLSALLESLEEADRLAGMTPFEQALDRINKEFDAAADAARELGADQAQLARIEDLRGNAIERLNALQRQNLNALLNDLRFDDITEGLTPVDRAVAAVNRRFDELRQQAIDLGASEEDLELIERRRTAAIRQATEATIESTEAIEDFYDMIGDSRRIAQEFERDFLGSLADAIQGVRDFLNRGFSTSSATPLEALGRSQAQFEELVRRASVGDIDAIRGLGGSGDALLRQAASFYGVGSAEFQNIEAAVRGTLTRVANTNTGGSRADALADLRPLFQTMIDLLRNNGTLTAQQTQQLNATLLRLGQIPARTN